ncbi:uncharacterized protein LOC119647001 [Hermetia illucens]|uniref:uncharacterized protein LOC119647001 n=1 Tax=Hermetia illucens TaxID=343691 RepID=UPI0018CBFF3A|nr:uncharacterized protein LOC119647001 [Hermetia illucens]
MWKLIFAAFSLISSATAICPLLFDPNHPGLFTRQFGSLRLILSLNGNQVSFEDNTEITGFCSGGFSGYSYYQSNLLEEITFKCSGNNILYRTSGSSAYQTFNNAGTLTCSSSSTFYETSVPQCEAYGLAYGLFVENQTFVFADLCFDLNKMQTQFVHYIAGTRTLFVESQADLNPVNISASAANVSFYNHQEQNQLNLRVAVNHSIPNYASIAEFQLDGLVSLRPFLGVLGPYSKDFSNSSMIAWWKNLRLGNWKLIEETIANIATDKFYDVYAGTSGVVTYPLSGNCMVQEELTFKEDQFVRQVPLYVWNYVKQRDNDTDPGVVIIGVNSPFFEGGQVLCKDMCNKISWLDSLKNVRKILSLGYIFCCKPSDVKDKLDNLGYLI